VTPDPGAAARSRLRRTILAMCTSYMVLGALWILFSDTALDRLGGSLISDSTVHITKGLGFVAVTTLVLFLMLRHVRSLTAQARMKETEERYQALFDRSLDCIFLVGLGGRILDANRAVLELLGYERDDVPSLSVSDILVPEDVSRAYSQIGEVFRTGAQTRPTDYTLRRRGGGLVEVESRASLVLSEGEPYAVQGILRDVTERRHAERALRESELRFRQMAESIREVFWLAPSDYQRMLYVNPAFEKVWGRTCEELYANPTLWLDVIHPDDRPSVVRALDRLAEGGAYDVHYRIRRPDGSERWINDRGYAVRDEQGRIHLTTGLASDVTEDREAEEKLELAATVFEHSREGIMICAPDGRLMSVNRAFTTITGHPEEEVLGRTPGVLRSGIHEPDFYRAMWDALREHGHWQGEIWNRRKSGELYPEWLAITEVRNKAGELTHRVGIFSDIAERKASEEQIRHLAQHDLLTRLPNRLLLTDRVEMALARSERNGAHVALLFIDLDRFKLVNDSLGHETGDQVLQIVAERLSGALRLSDTVSRQGGDEFIVLLTEVEEVEDVGRVAAKLLAEIARPCRIGGHELVLSASIGIVTAPENGRDMTTLLRNADAAMYAAKAAGRNRYQFFSEEMNARTLERLELERELRFALERDELFLVYQPQVDLASGRVTGVEALARWRHRDLGFVPPARFIPVAEESGLILALGEWVLRAACRQRAAWKRRGVLDVPVAVNVAPHQFRQSGFLETVLRIVEEEGLAAEDVELEVTESAVMSGADAMVGRLTELSRHGLRLAIDDFGTGYSSLSYLRRFPIHRLKIDRSFVQDLPHDPGAAAIASAIVGMGHSLGLSVLAEGVETPEQADFLREVRCQDAQGYLFCAPAEPDELERWAAARPPKAPPPARR